MGVGGVVVGDVGLSEILVCRDKSSSLEHRPLQPSGTNSIIILYNYILRTLI